MPYVNNVSLHIKCSTFAHWDLQLLDVVLFLRQITTWVSPEIDYEREFQGGLRLFQMFWDILILISGLVSVSMQS